jgi:hypothetical protein
MEQYLIHIGKTLYYLALSHAAASRSRWQLREVSHSTHYNVCWRNSFCSYELDLTGSGLGLVTDFCEHSNEILGFIRIPWPEKFPSNGKRKLAII